LAGCARGGCSRDTEVQHRETAALREAAFGNFLEARQAAATGLKLSPVNTSAQVEAAHAYSMIGDTIGPACGQFIHPDGLSL
jgi:hypothetical protein